MGSGFLQSLAPAVVLSAGKPGTELLEIRLLTLNDFLSSDVLCYLTRNKRMLTARLSLSFFLKCSAPPSLPRPAAFTIAHIFIQVQQLALWALSVLL